VTRVCSFAPVGDGNATRLILGSMPGVASLRAGQYYAHPRNLFWRILGELLAMEPGMSYADRVGVLSSAGIALWDVLESCTRVGSLDAAIEKDTVLPNDFATFFAGHPQVRRVYFNGTTAEQCYRRRVRPLLPADPRVYERLPSTSPAHAALSFEGKLAAWRVVTNGAGGARLPASRSRRR
jgi:hypoxanthine-DNA glycosylase